MAKAKKGGLGKGLDALFVDNQTPDIENGVTMVRVSDIEPNKEQPRKHFDDQALSELADSIQQHGVLQPLLVRPMESGSYQLVAGERRWRASRMAGLLEVPVVIKEMDDKEAMEVALIENLQREDLNPVEEALGYKQLMDTYTLTQEQIAQRVGKSRPVVANALRLLRLPEPVVGMLRDGKITSGHARAILSLENEELMLETARKAADGAVSVREIENLAKQGRRQDKEKVSSPSGEHDLIWGEKNFYHEMELALSQELHRKVKITEKNDKGTLEVAFYNKEELVDLVQRLAKIEG